MYKVVWDENSINDLKRLGSDIAKRIATKVEGHLSKNPEALGRPLSHQFKGLFRYSMGDYRIIYEIYKDEVQIIVVRIGHRSSIY